MKKRQTLCYTSLLRTALFIVSAVVVLSAGIMLFLFMLSREPAFFDENALVGAPQGIAEEFGYTLYQAPDVCDVSICGNPEIDNKTVKLYLTNPESNQFAIDGVGESRIFLRAEIYSTDVTVGEDGTVTAIKEKEIIGKSGFICPGEYLEEIKLTKSLKKGQNIVKIKISTYIEENGASNGSFFITTILTKD